MIRAVRASNNVTRKLGRVPGDLEPALARADWSLTKPSRKQGIGTPPSVQSQTS